MATCQKVSIRFLQFAKRSKSTRVLIAQLGESASTPRPRVMRANGFSSWVSPARSSGRPRVTPWTERQCIPGGLGGSHGGNGALYRRNWWGWVWARNEHLRSLWWQSPILLFPYFKDMFRHSCTSCFKCQGIYVLWRQLSVPSQLTHLILVATGIVIGTAIAAVVDGACPFLQIFSAGQTWRTYIQYMGKLSDGKQQNALQIQNRHLQILQLSKLLKPSITLVTLLTLVANESAPSWSKWI